MRNTTSGLVAFLSALLLLLTRLTPLDQSVQSALAQSQTQDLDQQVREVASALRCPVCLNLSVADSPSGLASDMRVVIRRQLQAGESKESITRYFVDRYGEGILLNPPLQGFTLLAWLGATLGMVGMALLAATRVRGALTNRVTTQVPNGLPLSPDERSHYESQLDAELVRYKQGGNS